MKTTSFGNGLASMSNQFVERKILSLRKRPLRSIRKYRTFAGSFPQMSLRYFSQKLCIITPSQISLWCSLTFPLISIICHIRPSFHQTIKLHRKFCINYHHLDFLSLLKDFSCLNNSNGLIALPQLDCEADHPHPSEHQNSQNLCLPMLHSLCHSSQKYPEEVAFSRNTRLKLLEDHSKSTNCHHK